MTEDVDVLKSFMDLAPEERAAALAHWIYVQTSLRDDNEWPLRVAESWNDLNPGPKKSNILTIDTWSRHPQIIGSLGGRSECLSSTRQKATSGRSR